MLASKAIIDIFHFFPRIVSLSQRLFQFSGNVSKIFEIPLPFTVFTSVWPASPVGMPWPGFIDCSVFNGIWMAAVPVGVLNTIGQLITSLRLDVKVELPLNPGWFRLIFRLNRKLSCPRKVSFLRETIENSSSLSSFLVIGKTDSSTLYIFPFP